MRKAADLLTHARRASTKESYATKWTRLGFLVSSQ